MTTNSTFPGQSRQEVEQTAGLAPAGQGCTGSTLLDEFLKDADIVTSKQIVVMATPEVTFSALKSVDFAAIHSPLIRALLALRVFLVRRARRRLGLEPLPSPAKFTLRNVEDYGQIKLAEIPGVEIVVGAIARPGDVESLFERRTPEEFKAFDCPGYVKAAGSFLVVPFGEKRSLVSYEARIRATDTATRRKLFFWSNLTAPLMELAARRTVEYIRDVAERRCASTARRRAH